MKLLEGKTPIVIDFGELKINFEKEFSCPTCGEKVKISRDKVVNTASIVITTCVVYSEFAALVNKYQKNPKGFQDYFNYAVPLARAEHNLGAISNRATSLATSIELACGHTIPITIECGVDVIEEPKKIDVLRKLGLNTKNAWRWLSYIYTGRVNEKYGKKKADEITAIVEAYFSEKEAFEKLKNNVANIIPPSITGLDARIRGDVTSGIESIFNEHNAIIRSVIHDLDETLDRVAWRPEGGLPIKSWVAVGET